MSDSILSVNDFIAGWVSGIAGIIIGHPADTVKVIQQTTGSNIITATSILFRKDGFSALFKGMLFPLLTTGVINSTFFGVYGNSLRFIEKYEQRKNDHEYNIFIAGCIGGIGQAFLANPVELIKINLQTHVLNDKGKPPPSPFKSMLEIVQKNGFKGLYHGFGALLIRDVPASGLYVWSYDILMKQFESLSPNPMLNQLLAGGIGGVLSWIVILPADVIKTRLQSDDTHNPKYKGIIDCFRKTAKEDIRVFGRGFWLVTARAFPVNGVIFLTYDMSLNYLNHVHK